MSLYPRNAFPHSASDILRAATDQKLSEKFLPRCLQALEKEDGIVLSSGREALYLILATLLKPNDEIILPAFSCNVLLDPILQAGAVPVFADVSVSTLNMEASHVEPLITDRTKAILMTHQFGYPCEISELVTLATKNNLLLIEDAAPALGARYYNNPVGSFGDVSFFSFEQSKVCSTLTGAIIVGRPELLAKIRDGFPVASEKSSWRSIVKSSINYLAHHPALYPLTFAVWKTIKGTNSAASSWVYEPNSYGPRIESLSRFQKALGAIELERLEPILKERERAAQQYRDVIDAKQTEVFIPQRPTDNIRLTYSRFPILVENKESFHDIARKAGVDLGYTFSYKLSSYRKEWDRPLVNADFIVERILNIPITRNPHWNDQIAGRLEQALSRLTAKAGDAAKLISGPITPTTSP